MTIRKALVIGDDGLQQQLQPGDTLGAPTNAPSVRSVTNGESSTALVIGMPVYSSGADVVKRAVASSKSTAKLAGIVFDTSIAAGGTGNIAQSGVIPATTGQWDAVAGTTGGLAFGVYYFLDPTTPGRITANPPTTAGQCNVLVGQGMSTTELELILAPPILL